MPSTKLIQAFVKAWCGNMWLSGVDPTRGRVFLGDEVVLYFIPCVGGWKVEARQVPHLF